MHKNQGAFGRRGFLKKGALAGAMAFVLTGFPALEQAVRPTVGKSPRIGTYKGNWRALLTAAKLTDTPYKIEWRELNNGCCTSRRSLAMRVDLGSRRDSGAVRRAAKSQCPLHRRGA